MHLKNSKKDLFKSKAKDVGTESRNTQYFANKMGNKINGAREYPNTMVMACLLGHNSFYSTHNIVINNFKKLRSVWDQTDIMTLAWYFIK